MTGIERLLGSVFGPDWRDRLIAADWPEDAGHENGCYMCTCCACGRSFMGHKRRVTCRLCSAPAAEPHPPDQRGSPAPATPEGQ
jgi:hypothetical protein